MVNKLDKTTVVPLGIVVSVVLFFLYAGVDAVTKYVTLETKIEALEKNYQNQSNNLGRLQSQIQDLNENMIRLSEIIKKLEEKIK